MGNENFHSVVPEGEQLPPNDEEINAFIDWALDAQQELAGQQGKKEPGDSEQTLEQPSSTVKQAYLDVTRKRNQAMFDQLKNKIISLPENRRRTEMDRTRQQLEQMLENRKR